jgi:hypothetical protein
MTTTEVKSTAIGKAQSAVEGVGGLLARYGLVVVIAWIGVLKFTSHEAQGIQPLVADIPFVAGATTSCPSTRSRLCWACSNSRLQCYWR